MKNLLTIKTFGGFSVAIGKTLISNRATRSNKIWTIFKYLITNRHKMVPCSTLIDILWHDDDGPENPQKSLHTLVSRLRKTLQAAGGEEKHYILFQHECYQWNENAPFYLDVADFESIVKTAGASMGPDEKLSLFKKAFDIYTGDYLPESSSELWALSTTNYLRRLYLRLVTDMIGLYEQIGDHDKIIDLCIKAIDHNPFEEILFEHLIRSLYINGETALAQQHYKKYTEILKKEFGAQPSESFRTLCQSLWASNETPYDLPTIKERLNREIARKKGAYLCAYDTFNEIYLLDKRSDERMKFPIFLALITVATNDPKNDNKRTLKAAVTVLRRQLLRTLRQGDIISQYSQNQFLIMLTSRMHNDAEAAMNRVKTLFKKENTAGYCKLEAEISQIGN